MIIILINSTILALDDPLKPNQKWQINLDIVFQVIYTI